MRRPRFLRPVIACLAIVSAAHPALAEDWTNIREDYDAIRNYLSAKKRVGDGE